MLPIRKKLKRDGPAEKGRAPRPKKRKAKKDQARPQKKQKCDAKKDPASKDSYFEELAKTSIKKKSQFYDFAANDIANLSDKEKALFLQVAKDVGKQFSIGDLQDTYANCMRSREGNNDRLEQDIIGGALKKCEKEEMVKLNALLKGNGKKDWSSVIKIWECPISSNQYVVFNSYQEEPSLFEPENNSNEGKAASPPLNKLSDFVNSNMVQVDVTSDGDCLLYCLYEALNGNQQYVADIAREADDNSTTHSGKWPESREEFVMCSKAHLANTLVSNEDVRGEITECLSDSENSSSHADGFISHVVSNLSKRCEETDYLHLLSKILANPGRSATIFETNAILLVPCLLTFYWPFALQAQGRAMV